MLFEMQPPVTLGSRAALRHIPRGRPAGNPPKHGFREEAQLCAPTFPRWDQSGGSSCPWGRRPFSRQDRNCSKCPPLGKRSGGLWIPSWLTKTTVPPLSTISNRDSREKTHMNEGNMTSQK